MDLVMAPSVAVLFSLLAACSAAKLGEPGGGGGGGGPAHSPLAFGDRLTPLRRLRRPVFLPLLPGVRPAANFSGALPPRPANLSVPLLLPLPPALRGAVNGSSPLLALRPPLPAGMVLPANFSTRVARHQLPFLVRPPPGVVYARPPPHLLNQLQLLRRQVPDAGQLQTPASTTLIGPPPAPAQSAAAPPPEPPAPAQSATEPPARPTAREPPARPTAREPSFLDYFIPRDGDGTTPPPDGVIRVPKLTGQEFLRAVRQQLPDPRKHALGKTLLRSKALNEKEPVSALDPGYLPPPAEEPSPPAPEYSPPPGGRFAARTPGKTSRFVSKRRKFKLSADGILRRTSDSPSADAAPPADSGDPCAALSCSGHQRCQVVLACARGRHSCAYTKRLAECVSRSYPTCHHCRGHEVCVMKKHCAYSETCPGAMQCMPRDRNE
ncbi:hypothetical protein FJT64_007949 [Amphibalanus amphitrite]|uniref:Uncharacterized protein n=1 Tax=Amphibalanus amphitrite TaxID=1232801 RepID=A0A6A4VSJ4_AMPAM|nr:hypothetical protein FJT64_007949 [Amphibalanus amphitrite]